MCMGASSIRTGEALAVPAACARAEAGIVGGSLILCMDRCTAARGLAELPSFSEGGAARRPEG